MDDAGLMFRALELAELGRRMASPNPMVGCVIARDGQIVGEGHHERAGGPHAEIVALRAAGDASRGATAYVTLEPCNHTGRTGPCAQALIDAGITKVFVAIADPNPVAAGGLRTLQDTGIEVHLGLWAERSQALNEVFFHGVATGRPFVVAKAAVSLDGRIAAADGTSQWLTGEDTRRRAHELRADADAVLVGSGTVLADDPQLTVRFDGYGARQPLRVVLDRRGRVTPEHRVHDDAAPTVVLDEHDPATVLKQLWERDVRSVLIEGGASVLHAFLAAGLVDRFHVHVAPVLLGDRGRPLLAGPWAATLGDAPRFTLDAVEQQGDDALLTLTPTRPIPEA